MSRVGRLAPWTVAIAAVLLAAPCQAQGNIDAGKTPAQIFADTCAACHRSARELKRGSAFFLRQHYSTGSAEASAMASYLAGLPSEPRAAQPKRPPAAVGEPAEAARQQQPKQPPSAEQAKAAQVQPKGRRPGATAEARPVADEKPPAPAPVLEPFYE